MKCKILLLLCLFAISSLVFAEGNCPDGMVPIGGGGVSGCMPIEGDQSTAINRPRSRWLTHWGAIAMDETVGTFGAVKNFSSKRLASKAAITACKANGGVRCVTRMSYYNQCAAISWGDTLYSVRSAETIALATKIASQKCDVLTTNCKIVYTECSLPVRVE